jgi:hypothetical protein
MPPEADGIRIQGDLEESFPNTPLCSRRPRRREASLGAEGGHSALRC